MKMCDGCRCLGDITSPFGGFQLPNHPFHRGLFVLSFFGKDMLCGMDKGLGWVGAGSRRFVILKTGKSPKSLV
jgi:hypothetical protein